MDFIKEFYAKMKKYKPSFEIKGLLTSNDKIFPLGTDTKVLSKVFELAVRPIIFEIANEHGLIVYQPKQQNFYPDFTLMRDENDKEKIAVDVKSTYRNFREDGTWTASFTLGSYTFFLRNETKNIAFPYSQYVKHYIIGFIYTRIDYEGEHIYELKDRHKIQCPFKDVEYFAQEKYRIAGERPGSGNTTNIGSITGSSIGDFASGNGPFAEAGQEVFLDYWRNYGTTSSTRKYSNLREYYKWKEREKAKSSGAK